ncbi:pitrilysin family protein [Brooklawnia cerclae]|uniref:Zn-dependent peptidase n=1 Tax=Brooklawnia cerclae TaxID=349934 RepID=A0ABX0SIB7_9ACTN|nr:pitrilysin family protein [Brooklawnia cerclae]NIH56381.1 putative Zn-dependent peptidase [Brooklawnia cerclae]
MNTSQPRPEVRPARQWRFPEPRVSELINGISLWLFDMPSQHVISSQVVLDAPVSLEPSGHEGVGTITVSASDEGSRTHPGALLAELLEDQGAVYGGIATQSGTICQLDVPSPRLLPALDLLAEMIREPAFDPGDVERLVALRLAEIEQSVVRSTTAVQLAFQQTVFDPASRSGRPTSGRQADVTRITADDALAFHRLWWQPTGATIILAGALPPGIDAQVAARFGDWQPSGTAVHHEPARPNPGAPAIRVVDRPGAVQADIQIGAFGPDRNDPNWAALEVAACAMGGSFGSRLNRVLREELGYTYGAHAGFRPLRSGGSFSMRTSSRTEVAAEAVREALRLLDLEREPFVPDEIADARTYLLGIAPLQFQTADAIAAQAGILAAAGMSPDWVNAHQERVSGITAEQANASFIGTVRPEALSVVVCGDAERLVPGLAQAGLTADVVELDI